MDSEASGNLTIMVEGKREARHILRGGRREKEGERQEAGNCQTLKTSDLGRMWWLTPVIPAFWEAEADGSSEVRSSRLAWPTW